MEDADLLYGDVIGSHIPFVGYENDGCRLQFNAAGRLDAVPILGVPSNLEIIAIAPAALGEQPSPRYMPIIPPEKLDLILRDVFELEPSPEAEDSILRGHAVMASHKRGAGEVFNGGTTEWAHALAAGDPFVDRITLNVLRRFGAMAPV